MLTACAPDSAKVSGAGLSTTSKAGTGALAPRDVDPNGDSVAVRTVPDAEVDAAADTVDALAVTLDAIAGTETDAFVAVTDAEADTAEDPLVPDNGVQDAIANAGPDFLVEAGDAEPDAAADTDTAASTGGVDGGTNPGPDAPDGLGVSDTASDADIGIDTGFLLLPATCSATELPGDSTPPVATILPGESTACQALGIAACLFDSAASNSCSSGDGWTRWRCYDALGKHLLTAIDWPALGVAEIAQKLPCSAAQMQAWAIMGAKPCYRKVPLAELPGFVPAVVDLAKVPTEICADLTGLHWEFMAGCALHHVTLACTAGAYAPWPESPQANTSCYFYTCGNCHKASVSLAIKPATAWTLQAAALPFLTCADYVATSMSCNYPMFSVELSSVGLHLSSIDAADSWPKLLATMAQKIPACGFNVIDSTW